MEKLDKIIEKYFDSPVYSVEETTKKIALEFAKHVLKDAAENAKTKGNCSIWNCEGESINKKSITDTLNKYL